MISSFFVYRGYDWMLCSVCLVVFVLMMIVARLDRSYISPQSNNCRQGSYLFLFLYMFNCVFSFWEYDTYHSWAGFVKMQKSLLFNHFSYSVDVYEQVYNWLADISGGDYFLWRAMIWIPACLFLFFAAKRLQILNNNFLSVMILFGGMLSYTRGMLGLSMLLFASILLLQDRAGMPARVVGFALVCASYFFHKSMYIAILFAMAALFPFGKRTIHTLYILIPVLVAVAALLVSGIASGDLDITFADGVGGVGDRTSYYIGGKRMVANIKGILLRVVDLVPKYAAMLYMVDRVVYKQWFRGMYNERVFTFLFRWSFVAMYVSTLFAFVQTSSWISARFMHISFFPMLYVLGVLWTREPEGNRWVRFLIITQSLFFAYTMFYRVWKWSML